MEIGASGTKIPPLRDKRPIREGYGDHHNLFKARLPSGKEYTVFFDNGSTSAYCSKSLACHLERYSSRKSATIRGVGGRGPSIDDDVLVPGQFATTDSWSDSFLVACGVVEDGTFPADLVLGKSIFYKWRISFHNGPMEYMRLNAFADRPVIVPNKSLPREFLANESTFSSMETPLTVAWGKNTPVKDPEVHAYIREYEERFPGLFDPAKRN